MAAASIAASLPTAERTWISGEIGIGNPCEIYTFGHFVEQIVELFVADRVFLGPVEIDGVDAFIHATDVAVSIANWN
jgi:hypothetical protein